VVEKTREGRLEGWGRSKSGSRVLYSGFVKRLIERKGGYGEERRGTIRKNLQHQEEETGGRQKQ